MSQNNYTNTDYTNIVTKRHNVIIEVGRQLEIFNRLKIRCKPDDCTIKRLVVLGDIICKDLCYIGDEELSKINEFLIRNNGKK